MKTWTGFFTVACLALIGGCAIMATDPRPGVLPLSPDQVNMYDSLASIQGNYVLVGRLRTEQVMKVSRVTSSEEGIAALKVQAASLGANGLMDTMCRHDPGSWLYKKQVHCSANAIRVQ